MTLKIDRSDALRLCMACTMAAQVCRNNALSCDTDDERAAMHESSARSWERRRDEIKMQIAAWDEKHKPVPHFMHLDSDQNI